MRKPEAFEVLLADGEEVLPNRDTQDDDYEQNRSPLLQLSVRNLD